MTVILSNISALEFWRSPLSDSSRARKPSRARIMPEDAPHATAIEEYGLIGNEVFSLPLHVMALDGRRKSTHDLVVHQSRFLPAGSLRSISIPGCDKAVFVTSPELTLVHMASLLSFPQTVHLGYEFCGTYAPDKSRPYGIRGEDSPRHSIQYKSLPSRARKRQGNENGSQSTSSHIGAIGFPSGIDAGCACDASLHARGKRYRPSSHERYRSDR